MQGVESVRTPIDALSGREGDPLPTLFDTVRPIDVKVRSFKVEIDTGDTPWQRLRKRRQVENGTKTILHGVNADMPSGTLTALIGSTGSGKTTYLNAIARRPLGSSFKISGSIAFSGSAVLGEHDSAYVMQQDILIPTLTVRETLAYAADLRLPEPESPQERRRIVEDVIAELGLNDCADTKIGDSAHKGCSGGERRRTSIGVQLLANPSILYCDEPTTGIGSPENIVLRDSDTQW